jgi:hypothetical protein
MDADGGAGHGGQVWARRGGAGIKWALATCPRLEGPFIRGIDCCRRAADHPSPVVIVDGLLGDAEWSALLARVLASEGAVPAVGNA